MMIVNKVRWEKNTWCDGDVRWREGERRSLEGSSKEGLEAKR